MEVVDEEEESATTAWDNADGDKGENMLIVCKILVKARKTTISVGARMIGLQG